MHEEICVVLVDDEPGILRALKRLFRKEPFTIVTATSGAEALLLLEQLSHVALIVSDQRMPHMNGAEFLRRSQEFCPAAQRVLLTGYSDFSDAVDAVNRGRISRYLSKPWDDAELFALVCDMVESYRQSTERERLQGLALKEARIDLLTGLYNRREMEERFEIEKARSERQGVPFSLVMIDIDHFKQINDLHGHLAGDQVLKKVADSFVCQLRTEDCCGRWGGDEFMMILAHTNREAARQVAEKLRLAVAELTTAWEGDTIQIAISLGVAAFARGMRLEECVRAADMAMFEAKFSGRNRVAVAP